MSEILYLINEMSPYLLLGFLIAGLMHAFLPRQFYVRFLSGSNVRSVVNAALLGIPLPLCSCGVIPTAMSLRREGASRGAVVSFLIATPQTGVDSICATYSLMGLPFAIIRLVVALFTAIFGGLLANKVKPLSVSTQQEEQKPCCCHHEETASKGTFAEKLAAALRYAFLEMLEDIGKWLVAGLLVAGVITVFVPDSFFAVFKDNTWLSILLVLALSIPMYVCATGSIPIAVALMAKGLTPGAALVLLMAGPAANMASILVIRSQLGSRTLLAYLLAIVGGAVVSGAVIDYCLPLEWFATSLLSAACCEETTTWWQWASTAVLAALLLNVFVLRRLRPHKSCCS